MKTVLITGGSRGIGAETVRKFCSRGWQCAFFYHSSEEQAMELAKETGALPIRCDVKQSGQVSAACAEALSRLHHLDAAVHCAGIARQALLQDMTDDDWHTMLDTHLSGAFYLCRAVLPGMLSRGGGVIIPVGSIWGRVGASCEAAYSAAKAGLIGLTKALAKEVGPGGVRVNCVCPGVIQTEMLSSFSPEDLENLRQETPLCALGTPKQVADCVYWLCTDEAAFITGQVIGVDGGFGQ